MLTLHLIGRLLKVQSETVVGAHESAVAHRTQALTNGTMTVLGLAVPVTGIMILRLADA